jgi:C-terminal processing protease CtpA/Prc
MIRSQWIALLLLLSGCAANPFRQFYTDKTGGEDVTTSRKVVRIDGAPTVEMGTTPEEDSQRMSEDGYILVGFSSFLAPSGQEQKALDQAKNVHAALVLVYSKYKDTISGMTPMTTPTTQTSHTDAQATAYGSGGVVNAYGTATTTTYGTETTYIPYSVNRSTYFASYWVKANLSYFKLGCLVKDLDDEQRRSISSNKGVLVTTVIKGTPAFQSDLLKGDIIRKIGGEEVFGVQRFHELTNKHAGQPTKIEYIRNGKTREKTIQFQPGI